MSMQGIVNAYSYAWFRGGIDEAATYLDEDLRFRGNMDRFDQSALFVDALRGFRQLVTVVDILTRLYGKIEAALFYDCRTDTEAGTIRTAEFFHAEGDRIDRYNRMFDATLPRALGEQVS